MTERKKRTEKKKKKNHTLQNIQQPQWLRKIIFGEQPQRPNLIGLEKYTSATTSTA